MSIITPAALQGIRVLDLSRVLAGPYCSMLLGDYGAEVIKVEIPGAGDDTRAWGPPWAGGESAYYLAVNRNKRSLTLNLKHPKGLEICRRLAEGADILIENFEVGGAQKLGLDYEALRSLNPGLIYCSITGYGQTGPYKEFPGYDFIIQAEGGLMSINGPVEGEPYKVGVAIVDITAGLFACNAILAALHHRQSSGEGQYIDVALLDSQVAWLANVAENYLVSGNPPKRYGNAHANIVPYQAFQTSDGYLAVGIGNDAQFYKFCQRAGIPELAAEPLFQTNASRVENREALLEILEPLFGSRTRQEWVETLQSARIPVAPINTVPEALSHPQIAARQMLQIIPHPTAGQVSLVGPAARLSGTPARIEKPPPLLGEHSVEILTELGYRSEEIDQLKEENVI